MAKSSKDNWQAFGEALARALKARKLTQKELGLALGGYTQSAISEWVGARSVPEPQTVFEAERILKMPPGKLSRILGYLPPEVLKKQSVRDAIASDEALDGDEDGRDAIITIYDRIVAVSAKSHHTNYK